MQALLGVSAAIALCLSSAGLAQAEEITQADDLALASSKSAPS
jgi:hypothetical protein